MSSLARSEGYHHTRGGKRKGKKLPPPAPPKPGPKHLTKADGDEIRKAHARGVSRKELARRWLRSKGQIWKITRGLSLTEDPPATAPVVCRHCRQKKVNRARGLCWSCYYTPGVKDRYGVVNKWGRRGVDSGNRAARPAAAPTDALPGTDEKLAVMSARLLAGEELFHPHDPRIDPWERAAYDPVTRGRLHDAAA